MTARRTANGYLLDSVGDLLMAGAPELSGEGRWTMPVILGILRRGEIGRVGIISVDAETGEVLFSQEDLAEVIGRVRALVGAATP